MAQPPSGPWLLLGNLAGVPVIVHWSLPLIGLSSGLFVISAASPHGFVAFIGWSLGCALVLLVHELGHMVAARLAGLQVAAVALSAIGGWCFIQTEESTRPRLFFVYASGVVAQVALAAATAVVVAGKLKGMPPMAVGATLALTVFNLLLIVGNLWPSQGSDGARLIALLRRSSGRLPASDDGKGNP